MTVETFLTLLGEGDDGHAVLGEDVVRADIDTVSVECPITLAPSVIVESVEIVCPKELEIASVVAFAWLVFVNLDPVDELVNRQDVVVPCADPAGIFVGPQVETETLRLFAEVRTS